MPAKDIKMARTEDSIYGSRRVTKITFKIPLGLKISGRTATGMNAALYFLTTPNNPKAAANIAAERVKQHYIEQFVDKPNPNALIPDKAYKSFQERIGRLMGNDFLMFQNLGYIW